MLLTPPSPLPRLPLISRHSASLTPSETPPRRNHPSSSGNGDSLSASRTRKSERTSNHFPRPRINGLQGATRTARQEGQAERSSADNLEYNRINLCSDKLDLKKDFSAIVLDHVVPPVSEKRASMFAHMGVVGEGTSKGNYLGERLQPRFVSRRATLTFSLTRHPGPH